MKKHLLDTDVKEVDIMVGLILEGGGSRGAYTAGVLDVLAENDIYLPVTYGVSAGACNALSYLSKQKKRNYRIFTEFASDKRYSGIGLFLKTGNLFGFDFIFGKTFFHMHMGAPVMAFVSFCFFEKGERLGFGEAQLAHIPGLLYAAVYFIMVNVI